MIQGGMNLVWTWTTHAPFLRVVCDRVFCDGAANEGVTSADTRVTAASGSSTCEPHFAGGETKEARSGAAEADPAGSTRCRNLSIANLLVLGQKLLCRDFNKMVAQT